MTAGVYEQIQAEIREIAEVLSRRTGMKIREVWQEALSLHRVRHETEVLADPEGSEWHE